MKYQNIRSCRLNVELHRMLVDMGKTPLLVPTVKKAVSELPEASNEVDIYYFRMSKRG